MALVSPQDVSIRLALDEKKPYFPGEHIRGTVLLACPRAVSPHGIRLIWAGGVTIRPSPQDQENYLYFRRNYAINNDKMEGKKVSNGVAYKSSAFVENQDTTTPLYFVMEQSVTYSFAFDVKVPIDVPLPSSTEAEASMLGGKIVYTIECCLDLIMNDPHPARAHTMVTVLENMNVGIPELAVPRTVESVYALWLTGNSKSNQCDYRTAMRATLPVQACARGDNLTIVIHVWHSAEFQRPKGVTVSLVRLRQLHYHGSDYAFPDETILSMRADVDLRQEKRYVQTLNCCLPIRPDITPSIGAIAKLLEISYKIHIKVQLQEGTYQTPAGDTQSFMSVEIPLLIGTVPLIKGKKKVIPRKNVPQPITPESKKSDGSKGNDNQSVGSSDTKKKQSYFGRKSSKQEEKKDGTLRRIIPSMFKKPKPSNDTATEISSTHSNNHADDEPIQNNSGISSAKNTDYDQRNSYHNGSQHSQSISSPRTEDIKLTSQLQGMQIGNQPTKATDSEMELKPDEIDDEIYDLEYLAAINKAKEANRLDSIKDASSTGLPGNDSLPQNSVTSNSNDEETGVKYHSILPSSEDEDAGVDYHNIFPSSDDEDYELDDITDKVDNEQTIKNETTSNNDNNPLESHLVTTVSSDEEDNSNMKSNNMHHINNTSENTNTSHLNTRTLEDTSVIKPTEIEELQKDTPPSTSYYHQQLPSPPPDRVQHQFRGLDDDFNSDSDDEFDNSPLNLLSRKIRQNRQ
ncbi:uncharacterized protein BX664DRAFT_321165 [Halteromyces radiatus]|uniref:uncharacterized protein n=1 Tax=Halteromyces radiatus TaxID=101107 RepID=UPI002220D159|nr:uncharacterized protein BX664DRAFT_321165 [Halteromyces radiatus]KAI8099401.1 hypothetical protein BX664DRAFT_321165 [Halteromyces radiatus]